MVQIFVVEDELLIRQNIRGIVENLPAPYAFCGEASDGEMALSMMQELMPDILLTDIRMPFLDGFELIRHAHAMMPWLKVIIISGFDEFEYAQKAISLGVDQYLLKPIRPADLIKAIEQVAHQLEEERSRPAGGVDEDEMNQALRQHFMQQLFFSGDSTATLLEKARALRMEIVSPYYQPAVFNFEAPAEERNHLLQTLRGLPEKAGIPLWLVSGSAQVTILVHGNEPEALVDQICRFNAMVRHEVGSQVVVTTVLGSPVQRLSAIADSYRTAVDMMRRVLPLCPGQFIDVNDAVQVTAEILTAESNFGDSYRQKLQYLPREEVPALVEEMLAGNQYDSMLMRYYTLIDLMKMTTQLIAKKQPSADPKDVAAELCSRFDLSAAAAKKELFRDTLTELLTLATDPRSGEDSARHGYVISRAREYVAEHYNDPDISLISVAEHVNMSAAHFSTVFSQSMGQSFINYLTSVRVEKAKELLAHSDMKLSAIALEIGYNEPNYFSHVFRKQEGMTPKEYRSIART